MSTKYLGLLMAIGIVLSGCGGSDQSTDDPIEPELPPIIDNPPPPPVDEGGQNDGDPDGSELEESEGAVEVTSCDDPPVLGEIKFGESCF